MSDLVRRSFLLAQAREGRELAAQSDILTIEPLDSSPHERYILRFDAMGVITDRDGPREARGVFIVGVWFPGDYHQRVVVPQALTWLAPREVFHPNVLGPLICLGTFRPGTPLIEICYRLFSVITYQNYGLTSPLNPTAAAWARRHLDRFPIDPRPLKRRVRSFKTQLFEKGRSA